MTVGERIQQCRKKHNLSQEELGKRLFVSRQTISQWETDQTLPTIDNLMRLKEVFGISIDTLLYGDTDASETPVKTTGRTRKKVWIIVLCAVLGTLLLIGGLLALLRAALPTLYYRIYPFDRITGTVTVTVDGKPYLLRTDEFSENRDVFHGTPRFSVLGGTAHVRIRGGEKEPYGFMLKIDGVEHPMRIGTFHFNWWDVTKFDLGIAVDTTAKTVTMQSSTQQIGNDGSTLHSTQTETFSLSDPEISFGFGEG